MEIWLLVFVCLLGQQRCNQNKTELKWFWHSRSFDEKNAVEGQPITMRKTTLVLDCTWNILPILVRLAVQDWTTINGKMGKEPLHMGQDNRTDDVNCPYGCVGVYTKSQHSWRRQRSQLHNSHTSAYRISSFVSLFSVIKHGHPGTHATSEPRHCRITNIFGYAKWNHYHYRSSRQSKKQIEKKTPSRVVTNCAEKYTECT